MSARNPYELRGDLSKILCQLHSGEIDMGIATERCARLVTAGLDISIIAADIDNQVRLRQEERKAAAARQKDLMALHSFIQGVAYALKTRRGDA